MERSPTPLVPDLAAHGLEFMNFFFHVEQEYFIVENFWESRGVHKSDWVGLAYYELLDLSRTHTVSLQWKRTSNDCCDVRLAIDAASPEDLEYPLHGTYRIKESDFIDFFNLVRQQPVSGILSRYGAFVAETWAPADPPQSKIKRFAIETKTSEDKPSLLVDFQRTGERWIAVVQPSWLLKFLDKPVDEEFFVAPLQTAVTLMAPLLKERTTDAQR
jgi:hypothetical protein